MWWSFEILGFLVYVFCDCWFFGFWYGVFFLLGVFCWGKNFVVFVFGGEFFVFYCYNCCFDDLFWLGFGLFWCDVDFVFLWIFNCVGFYLFCVCVWFVNDLVGVFVFWYYGGGFDYVCFGFLGWGLWY